MHTTWVYQRPGKKGWFVGWFENGKRKSKALPTKILAEHFKQLKYTQINSDVFTGVLTIPWSDMINEYQKHKQVLGLQETSQYEALLTLQHFEDHIHPSTSRHFSQGTVDSFILHRAGEKISRWTLNKDISNLRAFANWAVEQKFITTVKLQKIKTDPPVIRVLTDDELKKLFAAAMPHPTYFIRVLLAVATGLRRDDIGALKVSDINLDNALVSTHSKKTRKSMPNRPLPVLIIPHLAGYLKTLPADQVSLFDDTYRRKKFKRICRAAGIEDICFHDLRKTFASHLARNGVSETVTARLLEHSSAELTNQFYINVDTQLVNAVERLPMKRWLSVEEPNPSIKNPAPVPADSEQPMLVELEA